MINGNEHPRIIINKTVIDLPTPGKNGREKEKQVDKTKTVDNANDVTIKGAPKYEFKGEYDFGVITESKYEKIASKLNATQNKCTFIPYSDIDLIRFWCYADITPYNVEGNPNIKGLKMSVKQKDTSRMRYTQDNVVTANTTLMTAGASDMSSIATDPADSDIIGNNVKSASVSI